MKMITESLPLSMFFILTSVTFFFGIGKVNGAFERIVSFIFGRMRITRLLLPLVLFMLSAILAMAGPGNVAAVAFVAPLAMSLALRRRIHPLMISIVVVFGANAGAFSPLAPTGILAERIITCWGKPFDGWRDIFWPTFVIQSVAAMSCYFIWFWLNRSGNLETREEEKISSVMPPMNRAQVWTAVAIVFYLVGSVFLRWEPAMMASVLSLILLVFGCARFQDVLRTVPWKLIFLICVVSGSVELAEKAGLLEFVAKRMAMVSNASYAAGFLALVAGFFSSFSSSSGIVMPALLPMIPAYMKHLGLNNALMLAAAVNIGSHLVDASPLSTLGALCLANASVGKDRTRLFWQMLLFGISMAVFGALACYLGLDVLKIGA